MSPDLYDDLVAYLSKEAEGDLVDGRWKPNKAMSLLQRLEEECAAREVLNRRAQDVRGEAMEKKVSESLAAAYVEARAILIAHRDSLARELESVMEEAAKIAICGPQTITGRTDWINVKWDSPHITESGKLSYAERRGEWRMAEHIFNALRAAAGEPPKEPNPT